MDYILFKLPIQLDLIYIYHYLLHINIDIDVFPKHIIEDNFPNCIIEFPSIQYNNKYYIGLNECIKFYEHVTGIQYLHEKALEYKLYNHKYNCQKAKLFFDKSLI